jgi:hypothetical protein
MRNRAKCKKCLSIIESFHQHDYVSCQCGEIAVDGGLYYLRAIFTNKENFIRIDDQDNEIIPVFIDKDQSSNEQQSSEDELLTKKELLQELERLKDSYASLPEKIMYDPVTHSDLASVLLLLCAIFKADCAD